MRCLWVIAGVAWSGMSAYADPAVAATACASDPDAAACVGPEVTAARATKLTFDPGRTNLTSIAKVSLKPVFDALRARPTLRVSIVGHFAADAGPSTAALAKRRAEVVKWFLVDAGIETDRIDTAASAAEPDTLEFKFGPASGSEVAAVIGPHDTGPSNATTLTFEPGHTSLSNAAKTALEPIFDALRARPMLRVLIVGHAAAELDITARRRAEVVKWYLVDSGIETDRIDTSVSSVIMAGNVIEVQLGGEVAPVAPTGTAMEGLTQDATQMARILADDEGGPRPETHAHHPAGANLDRQIEEARNRHVTIGADETGARDEGTPHVDTISHGLDLHEPAMLSSSSKHGENDTHRIAPGSILGDSRAQPPPEVVLRKLNARYVPGLTRCYRRRLESNAALSGRVGVSFTVDDSGKVIAPVAEGVDPELDACIRSQMTGWRFALAHDHKAPTRFSVSLVLRSK